MASEPTIAVLNVVPSVQPSRAVRFLATRSDAVFRVDISSLDQTSPSRETVSLSPDFYKSFEFMKVDRIRFYPFVAAELPLQTSMKHEITNNQGLWIIKRYETFRLQYAHQNQRRIP
jgi:hypothetical protein